MITPASIICYCYWSKKFEAYALTNAFGDFEFLALKPCLSTLNQRHNELILLDGLTPLLIRHDKIKKFANKTSKRRCAKANESLDLIFLSKNFWSADQTMIKVRDINQNGQPERSSRTLVISELETSSAVWQPVDSPFIPAAAVSLAKMLFSFLKQKLKLLVWHGFHVYQLHSAIDEWIVNPLITTQNKTEYQDLFQGITFRYKIGCSRGAARFFQSFHWNPDQSRSSAPLNSRSSTAWPRFIYILRL